MSGQALQPRRTSVSSTRRIALRGEHVPADQEEPSADSVTPKVASTLPTRRLVRLEIRTPV